jgi:hypothetical protein
VQVRRGGESGAERAKLLGGKDRAVVVVVLVAAVVLTAIWADSDRRKAARDVLALFFRWRW